MMRAVSYTRSTSCFPGDNEIPADVITAQNEAIRAFAKEHKWKITGRYSDRRQEKTENTAFEEMLADGIQRKFDAVIVSSIFRAGRDLWNAKEVLLQTFYYAGIGFAVVEDNFSSVDKTSDEVEAYFAEKYAIYRGAHIKYQVQERNRKGLLCWNDLVYGYQLSEDRQNVFPDKETAPVIRRIFTMYAEGITPAEIAKTLREEKVPTPKAVKGTRTVVKDPYSWSVLTIMRLLGKTVYEGHWTKTIHGVTHEFICEPIVEESLFQKVQNLLHEQQSAAPKRGTIKQNRYAGLVCDSKDGFCLHLRTIKSGLQYFAYGHDQRKRGGDKHVLLADVDKAVYRELNSQKKLAEDILIKIREEGTNRSAALIDELRADCRKHAMRIVVSERERMSLQGDASVGSGAHGMIDGHTGAAEKLEPIFQTYPEKVKKIETAFSEDNPWIKLMLSWNSSVSLEREVLRKYVSQIVIDQLTTISVELKDQKWLMALPEEWRNQTWEGKAEKLLTY